ncbi:hypothetical protein scyTo_0017789 [Scyliorhinus torazame]|uniref:Uncharacterized protein n=1 Tax=Scyliorhinus torazame TaxID=75743 RepID=A0A401Q0D2_SCYTO|nr:hypothetical protein [Scyliorhinus torazame]
MLNTLCSHVIVLLSWGGEMNLLLLLWLTAVSCLPTSSSGDTQLMIRAACQTLQVLNLSRNGIEFFMTSENEEEYHLQVLDLSHNRMILQRSNY